MSLLMVPLAAPSLAQSITPPRSHAAGPAGMKPAWQRSIALRPEAEPVEPPPALPPSLPDLMPRIDEAIEQATFESSPSSPSSVSYTHLTLPTKRIV